MYARGSVAALTASIGPLKPSRARATTSLKPRRVRRASHDSRRYPASETLQSSKEYDTDDRRSGAPAQLGVQ